MEIDFKRRVVTEDNGFESPIYRILLNGIEYEEEEEPVANGVFRIFLAYGPASDGNWKIFEDEIELERNIPN